jgi:hypothetical protein
MFSSATIAAELLKAMLLNNPEIRYKITAVPCHEDAQKFGGKVSNFIVIINFVGLGSSGFFA